MQSLVHRGLGVERETGVDLSRDLSGNDTKDFLAKLDQEVVKSSVDLVVERAALVLTLGNSLFHQTAILGLLRGSEDERGVGGGILRLVLVNGGKVTRVANDDLMRKLSVMAS